MPALIPERLDAVEGEYFEIQELFSSSQWPEDEHISHL